MPKINQATMLKLKKQRSKFTSEKTYKSYSEGIYTKRYRLKELSSGRFVKGSFTMEECVKRLGSFRLSFFEIVPVKY